MAFDYQSVLSILQAENEHMDFSGREENIKQLCAMCCVKTALSDYVAKHEDDIRSFSNGLLAMPEGCVRIVDIYDKNYQRIRYRIQGQTNAQILDYLKGEVIVHWWGIPEDENGLPPISLKQLDYCVAYIREKILRARWESGKLNQNVYVAAKQSMMEAFNKAKKKTVSRGEMDAALWMMKNGIYYKNSRVLDKRSAGWQS